MAPHERQDQQQTARVDVRRRTGRAHARARWALAGAVVLVGAAALPADAAEQTMELEFSSSVYEITPHSPVGQPTDQTPGGGRQWSTDTRTTPPDYDYTLTELAGFPDSGLGTDGVGLRFSNAVTGPAIGQLISPYLATDATAGEPGSGAPNTTFTAQYTIASATGQYQDGLALEVGIGHSTDRYGGILVFRHVDGGLEIGAFWVPSDATGTSLSSWRSHRIAGPLEGGLWDPATPHRIQTVAHFVADGSDQVEVIVDGRRADVVPDWEYYQQLSTPSAPKKAVRNLNLRVAGSAPSTDGIGYTQGLGAVPATAGNGFLLSDMSYGSSNVPWTPVAPSHEPIVDPDGPATPGIEPLDPSTVTQDGRDVTVALGAAAADRQIGSYLVDADGARIFAGWTLSGSDGTVAYTVSDDVPAGTYSLVAYDSTSGLVGWASQALVIEAPPREPPPTSPPPTEPPPTAPTPTGPPPTNPPSTAPTPSPLPGTAPPLPPAAEPDPDGPVPVSTTTTAPGEVVSVFFPPGTFQPYEHVYATWYSTPVFGGWLSADVDGSLSATLTVPADLPAATHILQLTGTMSGLVFASTVTVLAADRGASGLPGVLPSTGIDPLAPLVVITGLVAVGTGLVLLARRRKTHRRDG